MESSGKKPAEARFRQLLEDARQYPNILAFWLGGSRGKGLITPHSDYDCSMIVRDHVLDEYRAKYAGFGEPEIELSVSTFDRLRGYAAWGSPEAWDRYNFAHVRALVDKTGEAQKLIDEKATVPANEILRFVHRSLDHYLNQVYRSLKCIRDGQTVAAHFEAAEEINPLLDAVFALNGRVRPYFKYLEWELTEHPLAKLGIEPRELVRTLFEILSSADIRNQQTLLGKVEALFRAEGYGKTFDGWGSNFGWMKSFRSDKS